MPEMVAFTCEHCGKPFERLARKVRAQEKSGNRIRFCSHECSRTAPRPVRKQMQSFSCERCGNEFKIRASDARFRIRSGSPPRYCSRHCKASVPRGKTTIPLLCERCGKEYSNFPAWVKKLESRGHHSRFCSRECQWAARSFGPTTHTCPLCGKIFTREYRTRKNTWCSRQCAMKARSTAVTVLCQRCGKPTKRKASQLRPGKQFFCSLECSATYARPNNARQGYRPDLGITFRSSWEANFARILNALGFRFEFEPKVFHLSDGRMYIPDFHVYTTTGSYWVEVKGRWSKDALDRINTFRDEYPDERIEVIDAERFHPLAREWAPRLPAWEFVHRRGKRPF